MNWVIIGLIVFLAIVLIAVMVGKKNGAFDGNTGVNVLNPDNAAEKAEKIVIEPSKQRNPEFDIVERLHFIKPSLYNMARKNNNTFFYEYDQTIPRIYRIEKEPIVALIYYMSEYLTNNILNNGTITIGLKPYKKIDSFVFMNVIFDCAGTIAINLNKVEEINRLLNNDFDNEISELTHIRGIIKELDCDVFLRHSNTTFTVEIKTKLELASEEIPAIIRDFKNLDVMVMDRQNLAIERINSYLKSLGIVPKLVKDFTEIKKVLNSNYFPDLIILPINILKSETNVASLKFWHEKINFAFIFNNKNEDVKTDIRSFKLKMPVVNDEIDAVLAVTYDKAHGTLKKDYI